MPTAAAIAAAAGGNLSPTAPGLSGAAAGGNLSPDDPENILALPGLILSGITNPSALNGYWSHTGYRNGYPEWSLTTGGFTYYVSCWLNPREWSVVKVVSEGNVDTQFTGSAAFPATTGSYDHPLEAARWIAGLATGTLVMADAGGNLAPSAPGATAAASGGNLAPTAPSAIAS